MKKLALLAMAAGLIASLMAPAGAGAEWTHTGKALQANTLGQLTGQFTNETP